MSHIHEQYDFTVAFFVVCKAKVLLVNHPRYSKWIPPGGHIELNEDPEEALFREIAEETGLEVTILSKRPHIDSPGTKPLLTPNYMDVHAANLPHKHIGLIYFGAAANNEARLSDEHTELKWFSEDELSQSDYHLDPAVIFYAKEALKLAAKS